MDPGRIVIRAVFAYVVLFVLMRLSGKRTLRQANPFDFTLALILGDLVDDVLWAEVNASLFVVASGTLMCIHAMGNRVRFRAGIRR